MRPGTIPMTIKGVALVGGAACTNLVSSLSQWANSGEWPPRIQWTIIILTAIGVAFTNIVSFMSSTYSDWHKNGHSKQETNENKTS